VDYAPGVQKNPFLLYMYTHSRSGAAMQTPKLVALKLPDCRFVVRVRNGPRLGTIFSTDKGWHYQFDGTPREGPLCRNAEEALGIMEAVAEHEHMIEEDVRA